MRRRAAASTAPRPTATPSAKVSRPEMSVETRRHGEPQRRHAPAVEVADEALEEPRGRHRAQGADEARPEQGRQRREEHAVAGHVMAPVPAVVPQDEAEGGAVVLGREVRARRGQHEVGRRATTAATAHAGTALGVQERGDAIDGIRPVEPGPVPGVGEVQDVGLAAERARIGVGERRGEVGVAIAPHDERGAVDAPEVEAGAGERVLRARAVELEDRALRALVEVRPRLVGQRLRERPPPGPTRRSPTTTSPTPRIRHRRATRCQR